MSETYYVACFQISFSLSFLQQLPMMEFTALISRILLIRIGSATGLLLIENSDELEGTQEQQNCFSFVRKFYSECVRKMIAKFPFTDLTVSDLSILDPHHRIDVTVTSLTRLLNRFNNNSTCDVDAVLMEFRENKSLPNKSAASMQ